MQKIISWVLLVLGAFLVTAAIISVVWAPDAVKKTPLKTDTTTRLDGTALVPTKSDDRLQVRATSITEADSDRSDDDVVVFVNTTCLVLEQSELDCGEEGVDENADPNVITISNDVFAADRVDAAAVNDEEYLPEDARPHEGLINKFPFDAEKQDYPFWDGVVGEAVTAAYQGTESLDGLETYEFNYVVEDVDATVLGDIEGQYSMDKTMWIDPRTGAIIKQEQAETRVTDDGTTLLDLELAFTDEQVQTNVDEAKDSIGTLDLLTKTVPLVGFILGPILLLAGGFLLLRSRSTTARA
ncbi:porin PorA family protein [Nocardioides donggukensis]|uniref:DUF3068 domain-containing protein n=1 Tax=Nocardioides donggukensis TaxID=2774019 RepID=A0A927K8N1_9ACTN|nr:porin PorA family protein [Nocardioides donggukensis]MBD8869680.1 DUF3068 domain-containing protein [Nocardioides donggukensis]